MLLLATEIVTDSFVFEFAFEILRDSQRRWMAKCAGRNRGCFARL